MGKSLNGKELGNGISQRKDGLYQARFINRFGKRQTIYAKTLNEVRHKLRTEQYNDEKAINVVDKNMTLDEINNTYCNNDYYNQAIREEPIDFLDRSFSSSSWPFQ